MALPPFDQVVEEYHQANTEFIKGNYGAFQRLFSHRSDLTLLNPIGDVAVGWEQVRQVQERAMSHYQGGEATGFENLVTYVTPELAFIVEIERQMTTVGGSSEKAPVALRVTTIFRPEDETWKIVHRHADPISAPRPPESVIQR
jgi:ketosteroid isomerase-like protein